MEPRLLLFDKPQNVRKVDQQENSADGSDGHQTTAWSHASSLTPPHHVPLDRGYHRSTPLAMRNASVTGQQSNHVDSDMDLMKMVQTYSHGKFNALAYWLVAKGLLEGIN